MIGFKKIEMIVIRSVSHTIHILGTVSHVCFGGELI